MSLHPFDELVSRLLQLHQGAPAERRELLARAASDACDVLDRSHAAYVAVGGVETGAELLALIDARTRLLGAVEGEDRPLRCDVVKDLDIEAYDRELVKVAPMIDVVLHAWLGRAWSAVASDAAGSVAP